MKPWYFERNLNLPLTVSTETLSVFKIYHIFSNIWFSITYAETYCKLHINWHPDFHQSNTVFHWLCVLESQIDVERPKPFFFCLLSSLIVLPTFILKLWFRLLLNFLLHWLTIFDHWPIVEMSAPNFKTAHRAESSSCTGNFLILLYYYRIPQRWCIILHLLVFDTAKDKVSRFRSNLNWALRADICSTTNLSAFKIKLDLYAFQIVVLTKLLLVMDD